jgi:hypothetical protein
VRVVSVSKHIFDILTKNEGYCRAEDFTTNPIFFDVFDGLSLMLHIETQPTSSNKNQVHLYNNNATL